MDGGRDWFWHKFVVGAIAFVVLLPLFCLFFYCSISRLYGFRTIDPDVLCLGIFVVGIFVSSYGAYRVVDIYERKIMGDGRFR